MRLIKIFPRGSNGSEATPQEIEHLLRLEASLLRIPRRSSKMACSDTQAVLQGILECSIGSNMDGCDSSEPESYQLWCLHDLL